MRDRLSGIFLRPVDGLYLTADRKGKTRLALVDRDRSIRMPHIIAEPCIGTKDASCVTVCPVDCIHPTKDEAEFEQEEMLYIDPETCIDCGLCVDECPVKAIFPEEDLPEEWASYIEKNSAYYEK